jgi:hypothetical protein
MARTTENVCLTLRPEIVKAVDAARGRGRDAQSRSQFIDLTLERAMTGAGRLEALQGIAKESLQVYADAATQERAPNATQLIAESCADGRARLDALAKIAVGNRK